MMLLIIIGWIVLFYLCAGLLFAVLFVIAGVAEVDEGAKGSGWGFRLIIIPGCTLFWPFLLRKWILVRKMHTHD